ncbi:hypothetical protein KL918_000218 [Ogataea parapolymorpha]|uniref:Mitochondrial import receptor subunit TOM22 n=1 Tax=Ogataea parapolymorpha (strain ATCC 26012 / BCRC 20466 / JCM 22074 / NRRL Y-7560 / DL-1) TaxID=871575 RepID=W1Q8D4_OGAPD|nr:Mitochondrial import receptor subunit TOM22 [Ogataea parapolymorpha DL-1]ESW96267.1 Mitochondrial import receptor subunit TOM22 [Ogataea parapolymorpha DL-1]KAG7870014.1 hypothetical protein KL918_000218 [Ogataea parapolymorpha]KAG7873302.1 hypothetical protein KL916_002603 [Ogataea parapolymorpha]
MVTLTRIEDESQQKPEEKVFNAGVEEVESESEVESEDEFDENETLLQRIEALKDMILPEQRQYIASTLESACSTASTLAKKCGNGLWILTSSTLLLGVPLALGIFGETQLNELEKEMQLQQGSSDLLASGSEQQPATAAR